MRQTAATRAHHTTLRPAAVGLVVVSIAIIGILGLLSAPSSVSSIDEAKATGVHRAPSSSVSSAPSIDAAPRAERGAAIPNDGGSITEEDGALSDGVTVFDDEYPGIADLHPDLLRALRAAAADAADDGIAFTVNSGWRSRTYQDRLLREAVSKYGSVKEAARWVATADTSPHVSGDAIDIGSVDASAWLSKHGARYGLCQVYRNEPWHYELRPKAVDRRCPPMYADPTHDPRMQP